MTEAGLAHRDVAHHELVRGGQPPAQLAVEQHRYGGRRHHAHLHLQRGQRLQVGGQLRARRERQRHRQATLQGGT